MEEYTAFVSAVSVFRSRNIDFSDCLILASAKKNDAIPVYTFDKKFARMESVKILEE